MAPPPEEFDEWLSPQEVLEMMPGHLTARGKREAIAKRMQDGIIRVRADKFVAKPGAPVQRYVEAKPDVWRGWAYLADDGSAEQFWRFGEFERFARDSTGYGGSIEQRLYGIRLEPDAVREMVRELSPRDRGIEALDKSLAQMRAALGASAERATTARPALANLDALPPPRGRPPAAFWEDLILEIAHRMHLGDFKPETQAEVEDAMARWIMARGYTGGRETQIKERARKVFKLFKD